MKTAEQMVNEKNQEMVCTAPETTVHDALDKMLSVRIGAMLIKRDDKIIGIWTERDLMRNVIAPGFDCKSAQLGDLMTTKLVTVPHDATVYNLKDKLLGMRLRHLLVEKDGQYIGILSIGDVIRASLDAKDKELTSLSASVNWEYYEDWKWKKKH